MAQSKVSGGDRQSVSAGGPVAAAVRDERMKIMVSRAADRHIVSALGQALLQLSPATLQSAVGLADQPVADRVKRIIAVERIAVIQAECRDRLALAGARRRGQGHAGSVVQLKAVPIDFRGVGDCDRPDHLRAVRRHTEIAQILGLIERVVRACCRHRLQQTGPGGGGRQAARFQVFDAQPNTRTGTAARDSRRSQVDGHNVLPLLKHTRTMFRHAQPAEMGHRIAPACRRGCGLEGIAARLAGPSGVPLSGCEGESLPCLTFAGSVTDPNSLLPGATAVFRVPRSETRM